jgi:Protein of unknown function (DUF3826)
MNRIFSASKALLSSMVQRNSFNFYLQNKSFSVHSILLLLIINVLCPNVYAQQGTNNPDAAYQKVIGERVEKIIKVLNLTDTALHNKTLRQVSNQYFQLNSVIDNNKITLASVKKLKESDARAAILKQLTEKNDSDLVQLQREFIGQLRVGLSEDQVDMIKDGMTYRIFPRTYEAYLQMLPNLTSEQKGKIFEYLREAREIAMTQGSSDDKHKVFGKYKGKINNYLSSAGYDMKKEGENWQKRIKSKEAENKPVFN